MSKNSSRAKRARNGFHTGLDPIRTKRSRYADKFEYEVRFMWWANLHDFQEQVANSGGNVKFLEGNCKGYSHHNGRRVVAYMNEGDMFILRLSGLGDCVFRAYRLIPVDSAVSQPQHDQ